jgi:hypothetical protein
MALWASPWGISTNPKPRGFPVVDEFHRFHFAVTLEERPHVLLGGVEGEIPHVDRRHPELSLGKADSAGGSTSVACTA